MSNFRLAILGGLLMAAWLIQRELFAVLVGVTAAWAVVRWRTAEEESETRTADSAALERHSERIEEAAVVADTLHVLVANRKTAVQLEELPALGGGRIALFSLRIPLLNTALPFCFTLRPRRPLVARDRLVSNSSIAPAPFEYALHPVALAGAPLSERYECVSNQPQMLTRMLTAGLGLALNDAIATHAFRIEELTWDGGAAWIHLHPVSDPEATDIDAILSQLSPLVESIDEHVAQGSMMLAAASGEPPPQ